MEDIQNLFKETTVEFMEAGLDAELDEELGYTASTTSGIAAANPSSGAASAGWN